jgi:hypothetical protein
MSLLRGWSRASDGGFVPTSPFAAFGRWDLSCETLRTGLILILSHSRAISIGSAGHVRHPSDTDRAWVVGQSPHERQKLDCTGRPSAVSG